MSLFPAYASTSTSKSCTQEKEPGQTWLENSSFAVVINSSETAARNKVGEESDATTESENDAEKRKKKRKTKKVKRAKASPPVVENISDDFRIDRTRTKEFLSVDTIHRPSVPKYVRSFYITKKTRRSAGKKFKRYYENKFENSDCEIEKKITTKNLDNQIDKTADENSKVFKQEEKMMETTAFYNRSLADDPSDINTWLKYVEFQDAVFHYEKTFRKGSMAKGQRVTAERKLAILDKALTQNPNNERLLRERLNVAVSAYPADELNEQLRKLVDKDQGNIILWQGFIESRQCSMSHCNTPAVLTLYTKCLSILHKLRLSAKLEKSVLEENILRMLYQCGLFLKQSGLFEQLWTLLRLYLELNLSSDKNKFNVVSNFPQAQLIELEEVVLNSQLPIHELWLRIEKLRESCHWLPYTGDGHCEDPQRLVFSDDVSKLIHPITMPGNTFKLTVTILTLLKVPLLPCRHTTMNNLGLDYVPWALDSIESLLPIFLNTYPVDLSNKHLMIYSHRLAVGPQYLKTLPGQEEYLTFVLKIIRNCVECLSGYEKDAISIWLFRFHRLLIVLEKEGYFKVSASLKKKIKSDLKDLLKNERTNVSLYREYALIENELGNFDNAVSILVKAIDMHQSSKAIDAIEDKDLRSALCCVFRSLIELHSHSFTDANSKQKSLKCLVALALGKDVSEQVDLVTQASINEAALKFKHVTLLLLQSELPELSTVQHFLPNFMTDWIICHGWFIYVTRGVIECGTFMEETLSSLEANHPNATWEKEILSEFYVAALFKNCTENKGAGMFKLLAGALHRSIEHHPNNLFLLSVLAKEQNLNFCLGQPFWRIKQLLLKTGHALPNLFLILISNQRLKQVQETWLDTLTGKLFAIDDGSKNYILALFRQLTNPVVCTRRCGLVWRLYLQFLHEHFDPKLCRNAYYSAVEECPWLKALYIDAAIYIPAELPQIQDLLIEKELRLHVTPEELDVLRN